MTITDQGPNHDLFVKVLAQIEREPQKWDQGDFGSYEECQTPRCFAGWAVVLAGYTEELLDLGIPTAAEEVLGIAPQMIDMVITDGSLFHPCNDLDDLYRISASYLGIDETVLRDKVAAEVPA